MIDERKIHPGREHQEKDDAVFKFFKEAMEDVGSVFKTDTNGRNYTSERVRLVCVFTFMDVLASYWYEYLNKNGTQKERFISWVKQYCLTEKNPEYSGSDFVRLSSENFYAFRSSMVHFFGIAGTDGDYKLTIIGDRIPDNTINKLKSGFRERGHCVLMLKPKKLYDLVLEGAIVMLHEWKEIINESQNNQEKKWQHIEGIDRIYQKVNLEGASKVSFDNHQ